MRTGTAVAIIAFANMKVNDRERTFSRVFRALGDRTRLRILALLRGGEVCVGDLVATLRVPQPTASRHLAYLRRAGLVLVREQGLRRYYRLAPVSDAFHAKVLECLATCCADLTDCARDLERLARMSKRKDAPCRRT